MASAVTPLLYVNTDKPLPFSHSVVDSAQSAVAEVSQGNTVVVPNLQVAYDALLLMGASEEEADLRIKIATVGPSAVGEVDPNRPVPLAPEADDPVRELL